ncbi:hypothetical protein AVEN_47759-1 [Araneus ventricosus]|uniref:Uncharacterized protein n=1 Tax=Araneus ventricosus TaxID=182803 RepID=A0A4Y2J4G4_ARAVE|nr:hypothetical protein AVEN_47759-1 [Araneus ventricosus]
MANVGTLKAFSVGAEKHGVNAFSQNEIEHFECCDDDVITSGEKSRGLTHVTWDNNVITGDENVLMKAPANERRVLFRLGASDAVKKFQICSEKLKKNFRWNSLMSKT